MTQPILSICIPTYNREFFLKRLLDVLLPQIKDTNNEVNIYISDNASSDGTQALCQSYSDSGFDIKYIRNVENTGADANIAQAFLLGNAKYTWILGDDEFVYAGALKCILDKLKGSCVSLLYLESQPFADELISKKIENINYIEYEKKLSFVKDIGVQFTFISAIILNKQKLLDKVPEFSFTNGLGTNLVQLSWVFSLVETGGEFFRTKEAVLAAEANNTGGYKLYTVFATNLSKMLDLYFSYSLKSKEKILFSSMLFLSLYFKNENKKFNHENSLQVMDEIYSVFNLYSYLIRPLMISKKYFSRFFLRVTVKIIKIFR